MKASFVTLDNRSKKGLIDPPAGAEQLTIEDLRKKGLIGPPAGAGYHLDKFIARLHLTKAEAAARIGVERSTLTRVINGQSQLTVQLAAKLKQHLNAPVELLFRMDAEAKAYQVKKLVEKPLETA